jgi:hypothetical protein
MRSALDVALYTALSHLGRWYTWGGDDPSGFDCSGLVIEALKAAGKVPRGGWDSTADGLMKDAGFEVADGLEPGCLVFWGRDARATHVEMIVAVDGEQTWTVGASGGGSATRTVDDARRMNAFVKIRPTRGGYMAVRDPFKGER